MHGDIFPNEIVGCPFETLVGIGIFWGVVVFIRIAMVTDGPVDGKEVFGTVLTIGLTFLSGYLWGKYNWMALVVAGGVILFGLIGYFILSEWDSFGDTTKIFSIGFSGIAILIVIYLFLPEEVRQKILQWGIRGAAVLCVLSVIGFFVWLGIDNISGNKGGDGN